MQRPVSFSAILVLGLVVWSGSGCTATLRGPEMHPPVGAAFRLETDTTPETALQQAVLAADARVRAELDLADEQRAFGVVDLTSARCALIRPDVQFYGASVPKIAIALAYFEKFGPPAGDLDPQVRRELSLMIKRSDNDLAAKYSQLVGLDFIQQMLTDPRYRLYDAATGGGLWCGKHYGLDAPRTGDPVDDLSHAMTVRQCLRYYLMLERGDLPASDTLREIFRAPGLDFHDDNFVRGLNGRDVTIYRKNGLWEDWHLDTARVRHGTQTYLLAGATRHPDGGAYLERMAAAVDEILCGATDPVRATHELTRFAPDAALQPGETFLGQVVTPPGTFNEVVPSWNVTVGPAQSFVVEMRVGRTFDDWWSPWLHVGDWGAAPPLDERVTKFDGGRIDIDYFRSDERYDRAQMRITASDNPGPPLVVERVALCTSDLTGRPLATPRPPTVPSASADTWGRLAVPFHSQKAERKEIAGRICSPTSVTMVLDYHGLAPTVATIAADCYDHAHGIYGIWPRNVQAAWLRGSPGYLTRFSDWASVERMIAAGQPLVISVRVRDEGGLRNAPYRTTAGHLIVLTGFAADGMVHVNDPAATTPASGVLRYHRDDLERVWMEATGGLAYVLMPVEEQ